MGSIANPWNVPNVKDFLFYCCPECDTKVKYEQDFINHALLLHEEAKDSSSMQNQDIVSNQSSPVPIIKRKLEQESELHCKSKVPKLEVTDVEDLGQDDFAEEELNFEFEKVKNDPAESHVLKIEASEEKVIEESLKLETGKDSEEQSFQCELCSSSYPKVNELDYHMKLEHNQNVRFRNVCHNCKLVCDGREEFSTHVESVHKVDRGYKCSQCGLVAK